MTAFSDLMGVLVPGGLAAASVLVFQGVRSWREGKTSREETVLQRWQRLAQEAEDRANIAEQDESYAITLADHWRQRSADLEFLMREAGVQPPPRPPLPQKTLLRGVRDAQTRRKKIRQAPHDSS